MNQKLATRAYALLKAKEDAYAGSIEFDYMLGIAANDAGQPGQAIFALERVLAQKPDYLQARAEIARAYAQAREVDNAKNEFELLAKQSLPPEVKRQISRYIDALNTSASNTGESSNRVKQSFIFESFAGWDNNVNFGTSLDQWVLAGGLTVTPQAVSKPRKTIVFGSNLAANWSIPINGNLEVTAGGQFGVRSQPSAHTLDSVNAEFYGGVTQRVNKHSFSTGFQWQQLWLSGDPFREALGLFAQWQSPGDGRTQYGAYIQHNEFTYPSQSIRDAKRDTVGLTIAHLLNSKTDTVFVGSIYGGAERTNASANYLSFNFHGIRAAVTTTLSAQWRASFATSFEQRTFQGIDAPIFSDFRVDKQLDLKLAFERDITKQWQIAPQISFTRNQSTLGPNDYQRAQALLFARYRF